MIAHRAMLDVPGELVQYVDRLLATERSLLNQFNSILTMADSIT